MRRGVPVGRRQQARTRAAGQAGGVHHGSIGCSKPTWILSWWAASVKWSGRLITRDSDLVGAMARVERGQAVGDRVGDVVAVCDQ
jgi:hypothetical protein